MAFHLPASEAAKLDAVKLPGVGQGMAAAEAARADWTRDDTERWLTDYPPPATFIWNNTRAYPRYTLKKGYGFWLRTAGPHYPALRGLFVLCHDLLASLRPGIDLMPSSELLAAMLIQRARPAEDLPWSEEDKRVIEAGSAAPGENAPDHRKPTGNPPETHDEPDEPAF